MNAIWVRRFEAINAAFNYLIKPCLIVDVTGFDRLEPKLLADLIIISETDGAVGGESPRIGECILHGFLRIICRRTKILTTTGSVPSRDCAKGPGRGQSIASDNPAAPFGPRNPAPEIEGHRRKKRSPNYHRRIGEPVFDDRKAPGQSPGRFSQ